MTHPSPPFYRIVVNSTDVMTRTVGGGVVTDWRDGYFTLDIPNFLHNDMRWQVAVDSFVTDVPVTTGMIMHCDSFNQPNSFTTSIQSCADVMFTSNGGFRNSVRSNTVGILISDFTFVRGKIMRFFLTTLNPGALPALSPNTMSFWSMTLIVYPAPVMPG